jgi:hypothetical protein
MPFHSGAEAAPATNWRTITVSDSVNLPAGCRGIYVGGAGNIALVGDDNVAVTFSAIPVGTFLPCGPKRVNSTNTTATNLIALY